MLLQAVDAVTNYTSIAQLDFRSPGTMEIDGREGEFSALRNQQLSPSKKRKLHADEEESGIDPDQPALKVLHVEEQYGGDLSNDPQSALMSAVGEDSTIDERDSFINRHQSALEALLAVEDRSGSYTDSLAALRDYSGADESPPPGDDDYNSVSFSSSLEPALEGLQHSQAVPSLLVDNVLGMRVEDETHGSDPQSDFEALHVEATCGENDTDMCLEDPQHRLEALHAQHSGLQPQLEARHVIRSELRAEFEALDVRQIGVEDETQMPVIYPQSDLEILNAVGGAAEDEATVKVSDTRIELEALPVVENCGESDTKVSVNDTRSELEPFPLMEHLLENGTNLGVSDLQSQSDAIQVVEGATGEGDSTFVEHVCDRSSELETKPMEVIENSGDDESKSAAKKRKLIILASVAAFFSTLAGALGSIGELIGQLEKTAMAGVSEDRDERTGMVGMTSTSTSPDPLRASTALRLHSAMSRSSSSLRNNIVVSMFLLMQQHRKRSQKRPRELTGPWYIKPRSAQAFESFLDFSPQGDPEKFRELFKISPSLFFHICEMVRDEMLSDTPRSLRVLPNRVLTVERQVAIAIRRLATGNQFLGIADSFGVSKSTAVKVTWKFILAFIKKARPLHLQWPSGQQMQQIKDGFKSQWGFPNCCGVVDGTHFTVEFPKGEDVSQYYDHQNHVSISMQAIVGHDRRFLDVVVGWPGSIQEYQLLQNTNFFRNVVNTKERLNGDPHITQDGSPLREYILGDAGYPLYDWLMVPYPSGLSAAKDEWNSRHAVAKQCVEDALVRLKGTWKILSRILWKPRKERIGKMVFACCLLHNMIIERNDGLDPGVYAGVNPHPGGYTGVSIPTDEVFEGGPEAREVLFREVMGGGIVEAFPTADHMSGLSVLNI